MTNFQDREKNFEQKYKHDQELRFKINMRRNKLLGLWVATEFGLNSAEAEEYAKTVVMADFDKPGDDDVIEKILKDCKEKNISLSAHSIKHKMEEFFILAKEQFLKEIN
ncbi:MAG: DUF1476 domain-containing protein [Alphaproteobacteria bacterium]|nr:DUF1476 domain-containing protein [Alphaproteobacteria bacterium]